MTKGPGGKTRTILILGLIGTVGLFLYQSVSVVKDVCYIFPTKFRGEFRIYTLRSDSSPLQHRDGYWQVNIPESGMLEIPNRGPFSKWHRVIAKTDEGTRVKVYNSNYAPMPHEVAIRFFGADSQGFYCGFIGTETEFESWMAR
jgi:hypothetical protein